MKRVNIEMTVGLFLVAGLFCFIYLTVKLGDIEYFADDTYKLNASFSSISGLKEGAFIELAGVKVGKVTSIKLNNDEYEAEVVLEIDKGVKLQEDSIAAIRTAGIIGDRFVNIKPGGSDIYVEDGDELEETESAISLEELVSKYMFEQEQ
jgi:phospholipid/cholesterol/gamma-HCH transport system substrate-binding protein